MSERGDGDRPEDVVLLHSPSESGDGIRVIRKRDDAIELGELRPVREGQPIHGEVVRLTQREESALLFDCEVLVQKPALPEAKPAAAAPSAREASSGAKDASSGANEAKEPPRPLGHKGPPRVTSDAYRGGWDAIFGKRRDPKDAPN
jgi:hypothetical protein